MLIQVSCSGIGNTNQICPKTWNSKHCVQIKCQFSGSNLYNQDTIGTGLKSPYYRGIQPAPKYWRIWRCVSGFVYQVHWLSELTSKCYCWLGVKHICDLTLRHLFQIRTIAVTYKFTPNITAAVIPLTHKIWCTALLLQIFQTRYHCSHLRWM